MENISCVARFLQTLTTVWMCKGVGFLRFLLLEDPYPFQLHGFLNVPLLCCQLHLPLPLAALGDEVRSVS